MNALQSPILWLAVVALAIVVIFAVLKGNERSKWGFKDVVKNPGYLDSVSQASEEVDVAAEAAKSWDDEKVASFTKKFVLEATTSRDAWALSFWLPIASIVTIQPASCSFFRSSGMAVISLLLSSTVTCQGPSGSPGPGTHHVNGAAPIGGTAAQSLATNGDDLLREHLAQGGRPLGKSTLKPLRVQERKDPVEGVMDGNAVGQFQKAF